MKHVMFVLFLFAFVSAQSQTFVALNNTAMHTFTKPVSSLSLDHELIIGVVLDYDYDLLKHFSPSISLEYNYLPSSGETFNSILLNANLNYLVDQVFGVNPYLGISFSYINISATSISEYGTGWTGVAGILFPISRSASMVMQFKWFQYTTETPLGNTSLQTGISYTFF